jgi:hypothetical protein
MKKMDNTETNVLGVCDVTPCLLLVTDVVELPAFIFRVVDY